MTAASRGNLVRHRPSIVPARDGGQREYLAVGIGDDVYGLPLSSIREIMMVQPLTEVPRAPAAVLGIFSVRGRVTTLICLRHRLRLPQRSVTPRSRVLLVDGGEETIGILVDWVSDVHRLLPEQIEPATSVGGALSEYVVGIGRPNADQAVQERRGADERRHDLLVLLDPVSLLRV